MENRRAHVDWAFLVHSWLHSDSMSQRGIRCSSLARMCSHGWTLQIVRYTRIWAWNVRLSFIHIRREFKGKQGSLGKPTFFGVLAFESDMTNKWRRANALMRKQVLFRARLSQKPAGFWKDVMWCFGMTWHVIRDVIQLFVDLSGAALCKPVTPFHKFDHPLACMPLCYLLSLPCLLKCIPKPCRTTASD